MDARAGVLDILTDTRADSLSGLQAKAKAVLVDSVRADPDTVEALAHSIAKDLIRGGPATLFPQVDPAMSIIAEGRQLLQAARDAYDIPDVGLDPHPDREKPQDAVWAHFRRATYDMRRANYYATRSLRALIAVGRGPIPCTASGVPAMPPMPLAVQ